MTKKPKEPHDPTDMNHPSYDEAKDPTHPFYDRSKADNEEKPEPSDEDSYKVGPGFPPKQYTWKKGGPSPNPKGRTKKTPSMKPDLKKAIEDALNEKVEITRDKKVVTMTKAALGIHHLVNGYARGDRYCRRDLFLYAAQLGVDLQAKDVIAQALGINEEAIVEAYVQRRMQQPAEPAPDDHVKAPPDLIDDDVTKSEPDASPPPEMPAKKPAEPILDEHGKPLPVSDIRYIRETQKRALAQQKKDQDGS
jgi:Family of unknown function (DUF5681)